MNEQDLKSMVEERLSSKHPGLVLVGAGIAGFIGFSVSGPLIPLGVGCITAAYLGLFSKKYQAAMDALDRDEYAHLLNAEERRIYEKLFGRAGYQNARAGDYSHAAQPQQPTVIYKDAEPTVSNEDLLKVLAARIQTIRSAGDVEIEEYKPAIETTQAIAQFNSDPIPDEELKKMVRVEPVAIAESMAPVLISPVGHIIGDRLRTTLITSVSGGGKDVILSNAIRHFIPTHPDYKVLVMDCKDDEKEYGYYDGLPNVEVTRLNLADAPEREANKWINAGLDKFLSYKEKVLLIINEGTLVRAKSKRYVDVIAGLVSSGDSREKYAWEAGQSAHAEELRISGAARSRFRMLIIGLLGEEMQVEAVLQAKFVAESAKDMTSVNEQMRRSPVKRAWSDGFQWYAMPVLKNYSGYNRDERKFIENESVPPVPTPSNAVASNPFDIQEAERLTGESDRPIDSTPFPGVSSLPPPEETVRNSYELTGTEGDRTENLVTPVAEGNTAILFTPETVLSRYQETEIALVSRVSEGVSQGLSPSDIVKQSLKLGKDRYLEGKALCIYLVRKYGNSAVILHFRKWLDE